jgi:MOSC domain-containing protein YiiM/ferredoxin-NADP reductase
LVETKNASSPRGLVNTFKSCTMSTSSRKSTDNSSTSSHGVLQEVRTGRIKSVFGPGIKSAIYKTPISGCIKVTKLGCDGDQQACHEHGGPDKALLQYCSAHYDAWKTEIPESKELVGPGAFGENLVAAGVDENDVCIGDVICIGEEVLISVCEPRQPCYMLNHRFKVKDMSKRAQDSGRTGWYCRVLREGYIRAGDEMVLVARPNPEWAVRRVQHYLYRDRRNEDAMKELIELNGLGQSIKDLFANRLRKQMEDEEARLKGGDEEFKGTWSDYLVAEKSYETPRILSLVFQAKIPVEEGPKVAVPGSHVRLKLDEKLVRAYSVVYGDQNRFELGIALSDTSRGGSKYIHQTLKVGDTFSISEITTTFPLHEAADRHIFIAGGIGLTAFISAAKECEEKAWPYHLHYLVRNTTDVAFMRYLSQFANNFTLYDKSNGRVCDLTRILRKADSLSHIYCCGSQRLMDDVKRTAKACGLNDENVHFEAFEVDASGDPFTACLQKSNKTIKVEGRQTLLNVLRDVGLDISSSCEVGNCGTCRVDVLQGRIEHRGSGLMEWEKGNSMLSCVSRGIGNIVLDI